MAPGEIESVLRRACEMSIIDLTHPQRARDVPDPERRAAIVRSRFRYLGQLIAAHCRGARP